VQAESPEEAKAKIIERYRDEGLEFRDYVDGAGPDHIMLTGEVGEEYHLEDEAPQDLHEALKVLIEKAGDLTASVEGTTDQFEAQVSALTDAASAAEKALQAASGAA
jgi:hypothetical protein